MRLLGLSGWHCFYPIVEGDQKGDYHNDYGWISRFGGLPGFSHAPLAGITYLAVQTIGNSMIALICGLTTGTSTDYLLAVLDDCGWDQPV